MKEKIVEALRDLGFILEEVSGIGYHFKFEAVNMFYLNSEDEKFVSIIVPGIFETENSDMDVVYKTMEKVNSTLKYVKAYLWNDSITLTYEREMFGEENLEEMLGSMIVQLESALRFSRNVIETLQNETNDADADDEADDADVEEIDADDEISFAEEEIKELQSDAESALLEDADDSDADETDDDEAADDSDNKDDDKA